MVLESGEQGDFLAAMAASSHKRLAAARTKLAEAELMARAGDSAAPPRLQLSVRRFDLIAEVKFRSPAAGKLRKGGEGNVAARVAGYADAGAACVSVLTEPTRFDGSMEHLQAAVHALAGRIPAMRKDFLVDPYQVAEARLAGAGGVLLILRMLDEAAAAAMLECAAKLRLFVLLECFDAADIERAAALATRYAVRDAAAGRRQLPRPDDARGGGAAARGARAAAARRRAAGRRERRDHCGGCGPRRDRATTWRWSAAH